MKKGLVLEGGAMRGLFTAGVLDVLMENAVEFDGVVGVSAGACFGCNYKSGQIGRTLRYNLKFCKDKRYCSFRSLVFTGDMYGADFCYYKIPNELDLFDNEAYKKHPAEFHLVCTDIVTGKPVYRKMDSLEGKEVEWIRASASMPLAAKIVEIEGQKLLDGGVSDSVPVKYFESLGFNRNVVVLTQPEGYVKLPNKLMPLARVVYKKYPALLKAMETRHEVYNATTEYIAREEKAGRLFVIRPDEDLPVSHVSHNPQKLQSAYNTGRRVMEKRIKELLAYLSSER